MNDSGGAVWLDEQDLRYIEGAIDELDRPAEDDRAPTMGVVK